MRGRAAQNAIFQWVLNGILKSIEGGNPDVSMGQNGPMKNFFSELKNNCSTLDYLCRKFQSVKSKFAKAGAWSTRFFWNVSITEQIVTNSGTWSTVVLNFNPNIEANWGGKSRCIDGAKRGIKKLLENCVLPHCSVLFPPRTDPLCWPLPCVWGANTRNSAPGKKIDWNQTNFAREITFFEIK